MHAVVDGCLNEIEEGYAAPAPWTFSINHPERPAEVFHVLDF